jgi:hypothetical protein
METSTFMQLCLDGKLYLAKFALYMNPNIIESYDFLFKNVCFRGQLKVAKWLYKLNPNMTDVTFKNAFLDACYSGHLHVAKWLLLVRPDINIWAYNDEAFRTVCIHGRLQMAQWLLQVSKERGQEFDISFGKHYLFSHACYNCLISKYKNNSNTYLKIAQWLQQMKPHLYVIEYDENGNYKNYRIRNKEEVNWERRKYLVWLASDKCPAQNKNNLLYKLPSDVSRLLIGFV